MIKLKSLLIEEEAPRILIPRNVKGRKEKLKKIHWRKILKYIKNGSRGSLILYKTPLEFLPDELIRVGGDLDLIGSKMKKLPDNLKEIGGALWLNTTSIEYLPETLTYIDGSLNLSNSKIKKLPDNLKIGGNLYLTNTPIEYLPENLSIAVNLFIKFTPLSKKYTVDEIRKMVKHIGGDIYT
jgi:nitrogenase molybdenum-iron protein alpha/beta subunit